MHCVRCAFGMGACCSGNLRRPSALIRRPAPAISGDQSLAILRHSPATSGILRQCSGNLRQLILAPGICTSHPRERRLRRAAAPTGSRRRRATRAASQEASATSLRRARRSRSTWHPPSSTSGPRKRRRASVAPDGCRQRSARRDNHHSHNSPTAAHFCPCRRGRGSLSRGVPLTFPPATGQWFA